MGRVVIPACFAGWPIRTLRGALSSGFPKAYTVLSFGDCSQGALGQSQGFLGDAFEPAQVEGLPEDVIRIAAGHYHSLAVTSNGDLWAWGRNNESQLGRVTTNTREQWSHPQKVQGLEGVKVKAAAGSGVVSMAIDVHGSLWAWGKSKRGQLGLGEGIIEAPFPQLIQALAGQQIVQVSLGWGHALACTLKGNLYSWGYPADGRLGYNPEGIECHGTPKTSMTQSSMNQAEKLELASKQTEEDMKREAELVSQWEPHLVDLDGLRALGVACGFDHSMVVCENGLLLSFGDNSYGQLGRRARITDSAKEWRVCLSEQVASISAGLGHSLAVSLGCSHDVGQNLGPCAYSWGWNSAFQLGRTTVSSKPMQVLGLAEGHVLSLDGGRVHSLAVNYEGELWTWGSGRNGRLGLGSSADEQQPCLVESIQDLKVQQAVCGMDHTIILVTKR